MPPAPTGGRPGAPPMANPANSLLILMVMFFAMTVLFTPGIRYAMGTAINYALFPIIGFGGSLPVITLLFAGVLMIFFSTILRHFFVDWVEMARNQKIANAFRKELTKARLENNTYKLKKLMDVQQEVMSKSMSGMQTQMKLLPVTMIVIIPIFAWLFVFVTEHIATSTISVPWGPVTDLLGSNVFPNWILLYSLLTMPFGQVLARVLKYFSFNKRLKELESGKGVKDANHN
ncbi:MAG: EMC3/TMCO1 family protein [Thermoplasmata archaeon]